MNIDEFLKRNFDKLLLFVVFLVCSFMLGLAGFWVVRVAAPTQTATQIVTGLLAAFSGIVGAISALATNAIREPKPPDALLPSDTPKV